MKWGRCIKISYETRPQAYDETIKKLYKGSEYEVYVKEEILMQSVLYQEPFDRGRKEGRKEVKLEVVRNALPVLLS